MAYDSPVAQHKVGTGIVQSLINEEILLLDAKINLHGIHILIKQIDDFCCRLTEGMQRLEIRYFRVKSFTRI